MSVSKLKIPDPPWQYQSSLNTRSQFRREWRMAVSYLGVRKARQIFKDTFQFVQRTKKK